MTIRPVFFITIEWDEDWAYSLVEGTEKDPATIIIYYQKIAGTSHLERLCGNIRLKKNSPTSTDLFLYEEFKASRWSGEDAVRNFLMVLKILRKESIEESL